MLLETVIKPRRDGTVIARTPDQTPYVFAPGADGVLTCEVADEAHVAWLINTGMFYPSEPADFQAATELVNEHAETVEAVEPVAVGGKSTRKKK